MGSPSVELVCPELADLCLCRQLIFRQPVFQEQADIMMDDFSTLSLASLTLYQSLDGCARNHQKQNNLNFHLNSSWQTHAHTCRQAGYLPAPLSPFIIIDWLRLNAFISRYALSAAEHFYTRCQEYAQEG